MAIPVARIPPDQTLTSAHVAVVGGGITGLSAAWYLRQGAAAAGLDLRVTVLEASSRPGGKVRTELVHGFADEPFVIEAGPNSFLTLKPWALELAKELGLAERLVDTNERQRKTFVLKHGRLLPLPDGVMMVIPTEFWPFVTSPLISWPGKLRMALDWFIQPRLDGADETISAFVSRRLGAEAVDRLAEPLMSGIHNAETDRQSLLATFPRFRETEEKFGSLIKGMIAARNAARNAPNPPHAMFVSLAGGTQELVDALAAQLGDVVRTDTSVERIARGDGGYDLTLSGGETLSASAVILATPAYVSARLLSDLAPSASDLLNTIRYVSTATISLGYRRADVPHPLDGFGLVIPRSENRPVNAITWTSTKFTNRAPEGHALIRVFFGGSRRPEMMQKSDEEILSTAHTELRDLMGIQAEPVLHRIYRWHDANPQYDVNHLQLVDSIEAGLPEGLYVTGSPFRGIGIPDCVHQGQQTAARVSEAMLAH